MLMKSARIMLRQKGVVKNMKKITAIVLSLVLLQFSAFAAGNTFISAELSLQLGSYIATVNGESIAVEAPRLSGGITLAPIEPISAAFDSGNTDDYKIDYNGTTVEFFENSNIARVNREEVVMPSYTEIVNGSLMVPIRFLCDTLGALIEYEDATCKINIKKSADFSEIFEKSISGYWCDEDYGWMIKLPIDYDFVNNEYDGSQTDFVNSERNKGVSVYVTKNDYQNINQARLSYIALSTGDMLRREEIIYLSDGTEAFYAEYETYAVLLAINGDYLYDVEFYAYDADIFKAARTEAENALKSFTFKINTVLVPENVSKLNEGGYTLYTDKDLGFSVNRMDSWSEPDELGTNGKMWYSLKHELISKVYSDEIFQSAMQVVVYSLAEHDTAESLIKEETERVKNKYSPAALSEITNSDIKSGDFEGKRIEYIIKFSGRKQINKTEYIECGDYVYEAKYYAVYTETADEDRLGLDEIAKMFDSIKVKGVDEEKLGTVINTSYVTDDLTTLRLYNERRTFSAEFPAVWNTYSDSTSLGASPESKSMSFEVLAVNDIKNLDDAKKRLYIPKNYVSSKCTKSSYAGKSAYKITGTLRLDNGNIMELEGYIFVDGSTAYLVTSSVRDVYASEKNKETLSKILKSFKLHKK